MTVNLFGRDASFETSTATHRRRVRRRGRVGRSQPTQRGQHRSSLAMKQVTLPARDELARRAENIETRWQLPARKWLRMLRPVAAAAAPTPPPPA